MSTGQWCLCLGLKRISRTYKLRDTTWSFQPMQDSIALEVSAWSYPYQWIWLFYKIIMRKKKKFQKLKLKHSIQNLQMPSTKLSSALSGNKKNELWRSNFSSFLIYPEKNMIHCLMHSSSGKETGKMGLPNTVIRKMVRLYNLQIHLLMTLYRCNMYPHALLANF